MMFIRPFIIEEISKENKSLILNEREFDDFLFHIATRYSNPPAINLIWGRYTDLRGSSRNV